MNECPDGYKNKACSVNKLRKWGVATDVSMHRFRPRPISVCIHPLVLLSHMYILLLVGMCSSLEIKLLESN